MTPVILVRVALGGDQADAGSTGWSLPCGGWATYRRRSVACGECGTDVRPVRIVALLHAALVTRLDGDALFDRMYVLEDGRLRPRVSREDIRDLFRRDVFTELSVERRRLAATFESGRRVLIADVPPLTTSRGEMTLDADDDLRRALFVAPTPLIWAA